MDMTIKSFRYYIKEGIYSVFKNKVMSFASISTVMASLFIFGIFTLMVMNVDNVIKTVESQIEIEAFMDVNATSTLEKEIEDGIKLIIGVTDVRYKSKEEALKQYIEKLNSKEAAEGLEEKNPLPASYVIKVDNPKNVEAVANQIRGMNGIIQVNDGKGIVQKVISWTKIIKIISFVLMAILAFIAIFLISNTIKITVYARRKEISIMRYIGATDSFIRWPFIIEGIILGFLGALIATIILWAGYYYLNSALSTSSMIFSLVPPNVVIRRIFAEFSLMGIIIGVGGSILSIRKFLVV